MKNLINAAKEINKQLPHDRQIQCFNDRQLLEKKILEAGEPMLSGPGKLTDETAALVKQLVDKDQSDGHDNLSYRAQFKNPKATCASHERIRMVYLQRAAARNDNNL